MKRLEKVRFFAAVALLTLLACTAIFGVRTQYGDIVTTRLRGYEDIVWGIDTVGGADAVLTPPAGVDITDSDLRATVEAIGRRAELLGLTEARVESDSTRRCIYLTLPHRQRAGYQSSRALSQLTAPGRLTLRENGAPDADGLPTGRLVFDSRDIAAVQLLPAGDGMPRRIRLTLTEEGTDRLDTAIERGSKVGVSYYLDDRLLTAGELPAETGTGEIYLTGDFTLQEMQQLAHFLQIGALPFALTTQRLTVVAPAQGLAAREALLAAGGLTAVLLAAVLLVRARLIGALGCVALAAQLIFTLGCITGYFAFLPASTLTLPGMAGVILGMAVGVCGTLLIARRIKEELLAGRNLDFAITAGFRRSYVTVLSIDLAVLLVSLVVMAVFGPHDTLPVRLFSPLFALLGGTTPSPVYGLGFTLFAGIAGSLLVGLPLLDILLTTLSQWEVLRDPVLYGGVKDD